MAGNARINNHFFHINTTEVGTGFEYLVGSNADEMNLFFNISEGGTFTAIVEAYDQDANKWVPWDVYQIPSYTEKSSGITDAGYAYNVSLKGIDKLRVRLSALNGIFSCNGNGVG